MKFFAVLITAISLVACSSQSSDEEQVRALVAGVEAAAESRDTSDVLAFIADDYSDAYGFDKSRLQGFLRGYFLANPKLELLVGIDALEFPADGLARAEITVTRLALDAQRERFGVEFRRHDGQWLVARADRLTR